MMASTKRTVAMSAQFHHLRHALRIAVLCQRSRISLPNNAANFTGCTLRILPTKADLALMRKWESSRPWWSSAALYLAFVFLCAFIAAIAIAVFGQHLLHSNGAEFRDEDYAKNITLGGIVFLSWGAVLVGTFYFRYWRFLRSSRPPK